MPSSRTSGKTLHHQPKFEQFRPQATATRPSRPEQITIPTSSGLGRLQDRFKAMAVASNEVDESRSISATHRSGSGRSHPDPIPNRFETPRLLSPGMPRRKPVAPDVLGIPVYDNGTTASFLEAQKMKENASRPLTGDSGYVSNARTSSMRSSRPSTSVAASASCALSRRKTYTGQSSSDSRTRHHNEGSTLYLEPLSITKTKANFAYKDRPLPPTPTLNLTKPPGMERSRSTTYKTTHHHDVAVRAYQDRQASQTRILNAQRAIDNGKWTSHRSCPEMDALTRDEKHQVNAYIQRKRDDQRSIREAEERHRRSAADAKGRVQNGKKAKCMVM